MPGSVSHPGRRSKAMGPSSAAPCLYSEGGLRGCFGHPLGLKMEVVGPQLNSPHLFQFQSHLGFKINCQREDDLHDPSDEYQLSVRSVSPSFLFISSLE